MEAPHKSISAKSRGISGTSAKTIILVPGCHRSGTSAFTRLINLLGAAVPTELLATKPDNPRGYWESKVLLDIHDGLLTANDSDWDRLEDLPPWVFESPEAQEARIKLKTFLAAETSRANLCVFKDPRLCFFLPLWLPVMEELGVRPVYLLPYRNPLEVALSLKQRNQFDISRGLLLWVRYIVAAERNTRGARRIFYSYAELLKDPERCANKIGEKLGITWPVEYAAIRQQVADYLSPELRHHEATDEMFANHPEMIEWVKVLYAGLGCLETDDNAGVSADFDRVGEHYRAAIRNCGTYIRLLNQRLAGSDRLIAELSRRFPDVKK
jgi:hypothetical protein